MSDKLKSNSREKPVKRRDIHQRYIMIHNPGGEPTVIKEKPQSVKRKAIVKKNPVDAAKQQQSAANNSPVLRGILKPPPKPVPRPIRKLKKTRMVKEKKVVVSEPKKQPMHYPFLVIKPRKRVWFMPTSFSSAEELELEEEIPEYIRLKQKERKKPEIKNSLKGLTHLPEVIAKVEPKKEKKTPVVNEDQVSSIDNCIQKRSAEIKLSKYLDDETIIAKETNIQKVPSAQDAKMIKIMAEQHKHITKTYNRNLNNPLSTSTLRVPYIKREEARIRMEKENTIMAKRLLNVRSKLNTFSLTTRSPIDPWPRQITNLTM